DPSMEIHEKLASCRRQRGPVAQVLSWPPLFRARRRFGHPRSAIRPAAMVVGTSPAYLNTRIGGRSAPTVGPALWSEVRWGPMIRFRNEYSASKAMPHGQMPAEPMQIR